MLTEIRLTRHISYIKNTTMLTGTRLLASEASEEKMRNISVLGIKKS